MPRDRQRARRTVVNLNIGDGALSVGAGKATYSVRFPCRLVEVSLSVEGTGTGVGNTDVDVNKNAATVLAAPGLRIASAAATKFVDAKPTIGVAGYPAGVPLKRGDTVTIDVDAIPATTASTRGQVALTLAVTDV